MQNFYRILLPLLLVLSLSQNRANGQVDVVGDFLEVGAEDAQKLTRAYLKPLASGVGGGFNSGWISTAKSHSPLGFSIQLRSGLALVPDGDKIFTIEELDLSNNIRVSDTNEDIDQTLSQNISGNDQPGPELIVEQFGQEVTRFRLPRGAELDKIPTPYVQASVGLIKGIEITGRLIPEVSIVDDFGEFNMWGFGAKANMNDLLPLGDRLPFDVAIAGGFNQSTISANLEVVNENFSDDTFEGQEAELEFDSFVGSAVIGKSFPIVSLYAGAGFQSSEMDANVRGSFPVPTLTGTELVEDPVSFSQDGDNELHGIVGIQFKVAIFILSAEYTLSEFQTLNAGLGVSFR